MMAREKVLSYAKLKKKLLEARHHFALLGVHLHSTEKEVKTAHRALAREFHPDINCDPQAGRVMSSVNVAYGVVLDKEARRIYAKTLPGKPCPACKGEGCHRKQKGFTQVVIIQCSTCEGSGKC